MADLEDRCVAAVVRGIDERGGPLTARETVRAALAVVYEEDDQRQLRSLVEACERYMEVESLRGADADEYQELEDAVGAVRSRLAQEGQADAG